MKPQFICLACKTVIGETWGDTVVEGTCNCTDPYSMRVYRVVKAGEDEKLKRFPLQVERGGTNQRKSIPWSIAEMAYAGYEAHWGRPSQTLERLAERGGFGNTEMDMFLPNWRELSDENELLKNEIANLQDDLRGRE